MGRPRGIAWRESGNLERAVETAAGPEAFAVALSAMLDEARGWRLAEMRKRRGMPQELVARESSGDQPEGTSKR